MHRKVFIATPAHNPKVCDQTEATIALCKLECDGLGWESMDFRWVGDSLLPHARNAIIGTFLKSDATDIVFLDSDVACGPGVWGRFLSHREDLVAGIYRAKCEEVKYPVSWLPGGPQHDARGLMEAEAIPFGFVRMTRQAICRAIDQYPQWHYCAVDRSLRCPALFMIDIDYANDLVGEDFYFSRRWRAMGGRIFVDPELPLIHVDGHGTLFRGHLGDHLRDAKPSASVSTIQPASVAA